LKNADFFRYGQMHRNTFICSPGILRASLQTIQRPDLFFAGQITGVEGYAGNIATGLLAGVNAARFFNGQELLTLPEETMLGSILKYISSADPTQFQPMKANFGILPKLVTVKKIQKRQRYERLAERALAKLDEVVKEFRYE
jgi:methylenetetrahydrofolate--tRNA-(uracil-5-)-methyltransferase